MAKKRIVFYIESMIVGGAEKVLIDYVNNLDAEKYDITVIALFKKSVYSNYVFQFEEGFSSNVRYKYLVDNTAPVFYRLFNFIYSKLNSRAVYRWLIKDQFDIEIAFYEGWPTAFVASSNQRSYKIAWLHTQQERLYREICAQRKESLFLIYQSFHQIVGVSHAVSDSFSSVFPELKPMTLYNPFDIKRIRAKAEQQVAYKPDENALNLLTVGRLIEIKGYRRLIHALAKCRDEGFRFTLLMIGDGELRIELQELVSNLNLDSQITFLGHKNNPYPYMKKADCLVCSSFAEGLNTVVIESVITGTPFLATDCGGMQEIVSKTHAGIICENSDEGLYYSLKDILSDLSLLGKLKSNVDMATLFFGIENRMAEFASVLRYPY